MKPNDQLEPTIFVIFGGAGDLTWRKLVPALFDLSQDRSMPDNFSIIAVDRVDLSEEKLRRRLHEGVKKFSRFGKAKADEWNEFAKHIHYQQGDFKKPQTYTAWVNNARNWKKNGAPKPTAFFIWPHRRACSAKSQNILARPDWRETGNGRGSWSKNLSAMIWNPPAP